jgi:hypothetical protein
VGIVSVNPESCEGTGQCCASDGKRTSALASPLRASEVDALSKWVRTGLRVKWEVECRRANDLGCKRTSLQAKRVVDYPTTYSTFSSHSSFNELLAIVGTAAGCTEERVDGNHAAYIRIYHCLKCEQWGLSNTITCSHHCAVEGGVESEAV